MKIVLQQVEFEKMAESWVYENLVEKRMVSASIVGDAIELEVFGSEDLPPKENFDNSSEDELDENDEESPEEPYDYCNR